jgi:cysteamine dioxygenase
MTNLVRDVNEAAKHTFIDIQSPQFKTKLESLRTLVSKLTADDLNLSESLQKPWTNGFFGQSAPASYIKIVEDDNYAMCIFTIKDGHKIPLHNHPDMFGVVKVLKGSIAVKSFTPLPIEGQYVLPRDIVEAVRSMASDQNLMPAICNGSQTLTSDSPIDTSLVSPSESNLHEISAVGGDASFLDILSPPYDDERDCLYYEQIGTVYDITLSKEVTWLREIESPPEFWTSSVPYRGPPVE